MGPTFDFNSRADFLSVYRLLEKMTNRQRVRWLAECCRLASQGGHQVRIEQSTGELVDVWADYRTIAFQGRLTDDAAGRLAGMVLRSS